MYEFFKNHPQKIIFCDVNLSNLENVLQRNLRADSQGVHLRESTNMETKILKNSPLGTNHDGAFVGLMYVYRSVQKNSECATNFIPK